MDLLITLSLTILAIALILFAIFFLILEFYIVVVGHLKGAPFVRSGKRKIDTMIELANIQSGDWVIDLGSGDGSILLEAAKLGACGVGIEINPFLVWYSRWKIQRAGFSEKMKIIRSDFWKESLQKADVIFLYLWPNTLEELKKKLMRESKLEVRIVSNGFPIKGWSPAVEKNGVFMYHKPR